MASPDALRALLLTPEAAAAMDAPGATDAAVLVPLFLADGDLHCVFTRRRDDLRRHAGEVSFPGGRQESPDEGLRATALREAEEEIGVPPSAVDLVGALPPTGTFRHELPRPPLRRADRARPPLDAPAERGRRDPRAPPARAGRRLRDQAPRPRRHPRHDPGVHPSRRGAAPAGSPRRPTSCGAPPPASCSPSWSD